jgi:hypothetical protein
MMLDARTSRAVPATKPIGIMMPTPNPSATPTLTVECANTQTHVALKHLNQEPRDGHSNQDPDAKMDSRNASRW